MLTSWPASANTCAMPWPISPAPITAIRALLIISARRIAAVRVEDVAGVEIRCARGEEEERSGEVGRFAEPALRHAGEERLTHVLGAIGVIEHPCGQRRAEDGRRDGVHRDAGVAPFAAERLGDAVDGGFRRAIGGVAGRMAEEPARGRHEDHLAALALLEHLLAGG